MDATAALLNSAADQVQAAEVHPQSVQHGTVEAQAQTREDPMHDPVSGSPEATDTEEQADRKEEKHSPANDTEDNISTASEDLMNRTFELRYNYKDRIRDDTIAAQKSRGLKYSRVAALYTEGLEHRVRSVEQGLLELQYKFGTMDRPDSDVERQVIYSVLNLKR